MISEQIPEHVIPEYNLKLEYEPSSTAAMLAEVERLYNDKEPFVFPPWCPSTHCELRVRLHYLKDPKNAMGTSTTAPVRTSASISSIVNEDLPDDDPVAYAFINNLRLNEEQLISLEKEIEKSENQVKGVQAWLKDNRTWCSPRSTPRRRHSSRKSPAISHADLRIGSRPERTFRSGRESLFDRRWSLGSCWLKKEG